MDALKSKKRFIQENAFKQKREEPRLKFNPGLTLIGLRTTGPWSINDLLRGQEENFYLWDQHGKSQVDKMAQSRLLGQPIRMQGSLYLAHSR